jgi:hypothetical protein
VKRGMDLGQNSAFGTSKKSDAEVNKYTGPHPC